MTTQQELYSSLGLAEGTLTDHASFIRAARSGLPGGIVKRTVKVFDNRKVVTRLLRTTPGNLSRYYRLKSMNSADSEDMLSLIELYGEAVRIFGDLSTAKHWMKTSLPALGGETPEALFDTFRGRHWVAQTLRKIEFGEFV